MYTKKTLKGSIIDLPANSGGRGDREIFDFKQHVNGVVQFDSLRVGQTQHFVIVQHGVHVFNPQSVNGAVAHDPFVVLCCILACLLRMSKCDYY